MDNRATLAGYKYYRDPGTGSRPALFVAFLNLVPKRDSFVNGAVVTVGDRQLAELDRRERNYVRREVTSEVELRLDGPVWAYLGSREARRRYSSAERAQQVVVSREYLERVRDGFRSIGPGALAEYEATTEPPCCPVVELERIEVPREPAT